MTWDDLTAYQKAALLAPCLLAEETAHGRYAHVEPFGTVIVTVNTGYE